MTQHINGELLISYVLYLTRITILRAAVTDRPPYPGCNAREYGKRANASGLCIAMVRRCAYDVIPSRRPQTKEKEKIEAWEVGQRCDQLTPRPSCYRTVNQETGSTTLAKILYLAQEILRNDLFY